MATRITREVIEAFLNCKYKGHLKLAGESGTISDYAAMTMAASTAPREEAVARLVARLGEGDGRRGLPLIPSTLKLGAPLLIDIDFEDENLSLRLDGAKAQDWRTPAGDWFTPLGPGRERLRIGWVTSSRVFGECGRDYKRFRCI
jgi:hypothetical protein